MLDYEIYESVRSCPLLIFIKLTPVTANGQCTIVEYVVKLSSLRHFLFLVQITSDGLWTWNESEYNEINGLEGRYADGKSEVESANGDEPTILSAKLGLDWLTSGAIRDKSPLKLWRTYGEFLESQTEGSTVGEGSEQPADDGVHKINKDASHGRFYRSPKESLKATIVHQGRKWHGRVSFLWTIVK